MKITLFYLAWLLLIGSSLACAQQTAGLTFLVNQEIRITGLPARTASSPDLPAVLPAALEIIFHDPEVCCGRNSALQTAALSTGTLSLSELAAKIEGKYNLDDGRRITITTEYLPSNAISPAKLLGPLKRNQPSLVEWKSLLYVLYGAIFDEVRASGSQIHNFQIHKLLLLDTRFSDARREVSVDRETNNQADLQGLLILKMEPQ